MKEMLKYAEEDMSKAARIATKAGYEFEVYDGDGENGPCEPEMIFKKRSL